MGLVLGLILGLGWRSLGDFSKLLTNSNSNTIAVSKLVCAKDIVRTVVFLRYDAMCKRNLGRYLGRVKSRDDADRTTLISIAILLRRKMSLKGEESSVFGLRPLEILGYCGQLLNAFF